MSVITRKGGKVPVLFRQYLLITFSRAHSAAEAATVQPDRSVSLHSDSVSEGGVDRDGGHAEQVRNLPDASDKSAVGASAFVQILFLCEKRELDVPTTVREA